MVLIKYLIKINCLLFLFCNYAFSSQILDFETEEFIKKINNTVLSVNKYNKEINFSILFDNNPNAFVNENNQIIISSGLIINSPSYIALLAVIAHEIGHIENNHIRKRKSSIKNLKSINKLGGLAVIAGSIISNNLELINALAINQVSINNYYINFTKDQEREADYYAINTLNKLKLDKEPLIKLINILEEKALNKGLTEEYQKFSTHPIFKERYEIINQNSENIDILFDYELENSFNFIKAKFLAYSNIEYNINNLKVPYKNYYLSIIESKKGNLKKSLEIINNLISEEKNNIFLIETKADILLSYGYKNQAIKFYEKVLENLPKNKYAQIRILNNIDLKNLSEIEKNNLFYNHINLIGDFPYSNKIFLKYLELSKQLNKKNWIYILNLYLNNLIMKDKYKKEIDIIYNNSEDKYLKKFIKNVYKTI